MTTLKKGHYIFQSLVTIQQDPEQYIVAIKKGHYIFKYKNKNTTLKKKVTILK